MKMSKWAVCSACKTGAQQPFKWSTSVLWQVSHLCQRTVDVKSQSSFCKNRIHAIKDDTNLQIQKKETISGWNKAIRGCCDKMTAEHFVSLILMSRSNEEVSSAKRDQNHEFIKLQFPLKTLFLSLFLPEPLVEKKLSPTSRKRGDIIFYPILLVILDSQLWLWLVTCTCSNLLFSRATSEKMVKLKWKCPQMERSWNDM